MTRFAFRRLTPAEAALGRSVFGDAIAWRRVRLLIGAPLPFALALGPMILFPKGAPGDFGAADLRQQAWLIHELTHVWQWRTRPLRTLASWAKAVVTGGYGPGLRAYRYTLPLRRFEDHGLEQQASIIEHAFLLREGGRSPGLPDGASLVAYANATPFPLSREAGEVSAA